MGLGRLTPDRLSRVSVLKIRRSLKCECQQLRERRSEECRCGRNVYSGLGNAKDVQLRGIV